MITKLTVYETSGTDPDANLALEEYLLLRTEPGECILYLWQNAHTVVIGKNQNCWKECNVSLLESEGGHLARRLSGGGAVYHDLGNLNFTFLVRKEDYNLTRQLLVLAEAVRSFGLPAEVSGRNDLLCGGRKFSGNAFYESGAFCYHHGTLLVDVDTERMERYLTVSREKLQAKGVDSVRARVTNLKELCPSLDVPSMKLAMREAFARVYGVQAQEGVLPGKNDAELAALQAKYDSWEWKYGRKLPFTDAFSRRFPWGGVELRLFVSGGIIQEAALYSDALDIRIGGAAEALKGCRYEGAAAAEAVRACGGLSEQVREDLAELIRERL